MKTMIAIIAIAILTQLGHSQNLPKPGECGVPAIKPKATSRIVNGEAATPHSRPYQGLLIVFNAAGVPQSYCGCSFVKTTHILTAAHCVQGIEAKNIRIYPGLHYFDLPTLTTANGIPLRQHFVHESYNSQTLANDVAVARLQVPIELSQKVGLICLADQTTTQCGPNHPVVASGWGSLTGDPNRTSASRPNELQQVALNCWDPKSTQCKALTHSFFGLFQDKSKLCCYAPNKGVCFGDSGGPLVREKTLRDGTKYFEQVGIMSGTIDCSFKEPKGDIYADCWYFHPWILNKINASP